MTEQPKSTGLRDVQLSRSTRQRRLALSVLLAALSLTTAAGVWGGRQLGPEAGATQIALVVAAEIAFIGLVAALLGRASRGLFEQGAVGRLSKIFLDNLLEHFPGLIYFKDRESRFLRISRAHVRHFKLAHEEDAWGKTDYDMFSGEHAQQAMRDEQEIVRTGTPLVNFEERETFADGRASCWVSTSKMPLRDEHGNTVGTVGVSVDVTQRKEAEEAARREQELLHTLMDNIPDLIYFKDAESRFTRINRAHASALGLTGAEEAVGKTDADFFPAEFARAAREDERRLLETGQPLVGKLEHDPDKGRWLLATKVPTRDESGGITGLVGISKDITERRQAEERLQRDLEAFLRFASTVAEGDLTQRAGESQETLGQIAGAVNRILASLTEILTGVRDAAFSVSSGSSEILAASTEIVKGAQFGRDQMHTTTSAVEEMVASLAQVSKNAEESARAAQQVLDHLGLTDRAVQNAGEGMLRIDRAVSLTAEKARLLGERSGEIFAIIDLIEEIASRSELLSMNAAIEAAHAGDAGRGFGVVAEEIGHLAERSTEATRSVTTIVKAMAAEIQAVLSAMETSTDEVKQGLVLSEQTRSGLGQISSIVQRATDLATEISAATREQTTASQTVASAMQAIANITEQSTASASETTRAVRDLVSLSEHLTQAISRFRIDSPREHLAAGDTKPEALAVFSDLAQQLGRVATQLETAQKPGAPDGAPLAVSDNLEALKADVGTIVAKLSNALR